MPETQNQNFTFSHREIAEILVRQKGLHEGFWGVYLEFGFAAANLNTNPDEAILAPGAIVVVQKIGIQRFNEQNNLTVDAAVVNPSPTTRTKRTAQTTSR